jgi:small subunit ribosomal protein S6
MLSVSTRAYEMMIIVDSDHDDAMVDDVVRRVETWLGEGEGRLASTDKWGKRRFAYEIDHKTEGHYVVLEMVTGPRDMAPLERSLRLADEVVRHKLIRLPDHEAARRGLLEAS